MRTFGFLAAFVAFTTTFAAPLPGPGAKVVAVRDLPSPPTPAVPSPSTPTPPATPDVPNPSTPAVSSPSTPTPPVTPAVPSPPTPSPGIAVPGDASVHDSTLRVGVTLTGICVNFQVNIRTILAQIQHIVDPVEDTVGGTVTNVTTDVSAKVALIQPLLSRLLGEVQDTLGQLVAYVVPAVDGTVSNTEDMTVKELGDLLGEVEKDVSRVLCLVATLIGNLYPDVADIIKLIIINLSCVLKAVCTIVGGVQTFLIPLTTLIGTILSAFDCVIPDLF